MALLGSAFSSVGGALLPVTTVNTGAESFRIVDVRLADDAGAPLRLLAQKDRDVAPGEIDQRPVRFEADCTGPPALNDARPAVLEVHIEGVGGQRSTATLDLPASLVAVMSASAGEC